jgi:hypothetical protein
MKNRGKIIGTVYYYFLPSWSLFSVPLITTTAATIATAISLNSSQRQHNSRGI